MIIGNGLIASKFRAINYDDKKFIIFASGVSNSLETRHEEFEREFNLLEYTVKDTNKKIVYFSSCAVRDKNAVEIPYYAHKIEVENYLQKFSHLIIRLPQVISDSTNENTIIGNFIGKINRNEHIKIQCNAKRYFIDIDDVWIICKHIINLDINNITVDLANPHKYSSENILNTIKKVINKNSYSNYSIINGGIDYELDLTLQESLIKDININYNDSYLYERIAKHFKK